MANNVTLSAGTADGAVIATDDIAGVHYQYNKIGIGADDTFTILAGGAGSVAAGVQRVTLASDDPAVASLAAIDTDLTTIIGHVDGLETLIGTTNTNTGNAATSLAILDDWDNASSDGASVSGDTAHDAADAGEPVKIGGYAKAAAPTDVSADGDRVNAWFDLAGRLQIGDGGGTLTVDNAGLTELAAAINASSQMDVNIAASNATITVASHAVTNAGTFVVQVDGAALTALQLIDNPVLVDDAAFTPASSSVMMAGFEADEGSTDSVDEGDAGAARMTLTRKLIVTPQPHTAGGLTIFRSIDIDESEEEVKATAGVLYSIAAFNTTAAPLWLKFYNLTAANTTVGSSTPVLTFMVPANADSDGAGFIIEKTYGWTFDTAISVACTTAVADADTGAPGANACVIDLGYL